MYGSLAHTEQKAINGPQITSVKPSKRENPRSINIYNIQCIIYVRFSTENSKT